MRSPLLFALLLGLALAAAGCGGGGGDSTTPDGGGTGPDTQAPALTGVALSTASLDFRGGSVTVSANVTDASGVATVTATIAREGTTIGTVTLSPASGSTYSGTYSVPPNGSATGAAQTYTVVVRATDTKGNASAEVSAGSVTVTAPDPGDQVPPPPVFPS
ncbi:MAG: hypothetical protein HY321_22985 [Armatimonadetes bacterium]|nr:hypothetical protein [Armatimonadota bacterium]